MTFNPGLNEVLVAVITIIVSISTYITRKNAKKIGHIEVLVNSRMTEVLQQVTTLDTQLTTALTEIGRLQGVLSKGGIKAKELVEESEERMDAEPDLGEDIEKLKPKVDVVVDVAEPETGVGGDGPDSIPTDDGSRDRGTA